MAILIYFTSKLAASGMIISCIMGRMKMMGRMALFRNICRNSFFNRNLRVLMLYKIWRFSGQMKIQWSLCLFAVRDLLCELAICGFSCQTGFKAFQTDGEQDKGHPDEDQGLSPYC